MRAVVANEATLLPRRPSMVVAGGDGTVAFVMDAIDAAFAGSRSLEPRPPADEREAAVMPAGEAERKPAVCVIALGTGNDLSATVGNGLGFTENHCCAACVCCPHSIERLLDHGLSAPVVEMDRWVATLYVNPTASSATAYQFSARSFGDQADVELATPTARRTAEAAVTDVPESLVLCKTFNNYVSFGMDADISRRFDAARKAYPALHTRRTMNKLWYGAHAISAAWAAPKFRNTNVSLAVDREPTPLTNAAKNCKAIVVSNVTSYSGGANLWRVKTATTEHLPRVTRATTGEATLEARMVPMRPASIADAQLEVQTLGGLLHMTMLRTPVAGADRIAQGRDIDILLKNEGPTPTRVVVQADGEPLGVFTAPLRLSVRRLQGRPSYVHCSTPQPGPPPRPSQESRNA